MSQENPSSNQISKWKADYGDVFVVQLPDGTDCYFRALTVGEYRKLTVENSISVDMEELAIEWAVLYPKLDLDNLPAGIVSAIAEDIFINSQFSSPQEAMQLLDKGRLETEDLGESMKAFVLAAIPSYTPEDLDKLSYFELILRVALAEKVIKVQQSSFGLEDNKLLFEIIDVAEEERKEAEKERKRREFEKLKVEQWVKQGGIQTNPETPVISPKIKPDDPIAAKLLGG